MLRVLFIQNVVEEIPATYCSDYCLVLKTDFSIFTFTGLWYFPCSERRVLDVESLSSAVTQDMTLNSITYAVVGL
jgi:hypothetical protein